MGAEDFDFVFCTVWCAGGYRVCSGVRASCSAGQQHAVWISSDTKFTPVEQVVYFYLLCRWVGLFLVTRSSPRWLGPMPKCVMDFVGQADVLKLTGGFGSLSFPIVPGLGLEYSPNTSTSTKCS